MPKLAMYPSDTIFQQGGAPPHYGSDVREYLDTKYPDGWIGRGGKISWPPRSPDLTPCDFFLWGYIKSKLYSTPVRSIEELKTRIRLIIAEIPTTMIENVWKNLEMRLALVVREQGGHIENYMS